MMCDVAEFLLHMMHVVLCEKHAVLSCPILLSLLIAFRHCPAVTLSCCLAACRSCRAKLQKRKERRSSKEFKSVTPSSSSTSKSLAQPAPVTTLSEPQQNLLPAAECSFVSGCLVDTTALPWGQHQRQQQPPAQQTMEASDVDYSFEEFSFDQTAAAAAGVCTAAGAQAAASAAPRTSTPPMSAQALDDFETMLSTLLQEELALLSRTEYACSRSTAMPLVQADAGAFNSGKTTGFASSARQSFELSAMPEAPQLSAPASPACWTPGTDGGMLASATNLQMVLPGSRPQALPAHMENAFVQPLGGAQYNSSSAPASLASFAPAAPCVPLMGSMLAAPVVPAAACEASYAGKQANVAKLAAMQNRLVSLELQLSVLMQSSGCPAVVPASHQHFQRINDSRRSPLDCCSFA